MARPALGIGGPLGHRSQMVKSPLQDGVERLSRIAGSAANQIIEVTRDGGSSRLIDRLLGELREASEEVTSILSKSSWRTPEAEMERRVKHLLTGRNFNEFGVDPFGAEPEYMRKVVPAIEFLYRVYFRAEAHGLENVPDGRCLLIANHSGQLPFDGLVLGTSLILEREPPRMMRAMVEKFVPTIPFFGTFCVRCGQVTGLPDNCRRLLEAEEAVAVFPEGARGISKPFSERYQMTQFGHGFMRLALQTNSPIIPIAVVGAEEQVINLANVEFLARMFGAPSFPLPALLPILGPLAMWPMPVKYRLYFGEPMYFEGDPNDDETLMSKRVGAVRDAIDGLIQRGLRERRGIFI